MFFINNFFNFFNIILMEINSSNNPLQNSLHNIQNNQQINISILPNSKILIFNCCTLVICRIYIEIKDTIMINSIIDYKYNKEILDILFKIPRTLFTVEVLSCS